MSDDLEQRLPRAFHRDALPPAPASLIDALERVPDAPVRARRRADRRSFLGFVAAAALVATVGALAISGGSPRPGPVTPTLVPSPSSDTMRLRLEYQVLPSGAAIPTESDRAAVISVLEARLASTGVVDATVTADGTDRIVVELPGVADAEPIRRLIGQVGAVEFVPLGSSELTVGQRIGPGRFAALFTGDQIASASAAADQDGRPAIEFTLKPEGTRMFAEYTSQNVGSYFAITIDDVVITAPIIQNGIADGEVQITGGGAGGFDATEAAAIVAILDSGPLPFPIREMASQPADASPSAP